MVPFSIDIPVRVISGRSCIRSFPAPLAIGTRALIVTGRHGASESGALADLAAVLVDANIPFSVFDEIPANPPLMTVARAGRVACEERADFIIGVGGGSAMDAAKATAAFAANPGIEPDELFCPDKRTSESLPIILVPTTAGTGSEANPYAVLTLPDGKHKKTFTSPSSWARVAYLDPSYTDSLPHDTTISTALDAFAHAMESYLSPKSNALSRLLAIYSARGIWDVLSEYPDTFDQRHRDILAYSSCAAGAAISVTGTGFPHPLGYSLTLLDGIPHGRACAAFHGEYIRYNMQTDVGKDLLYEFSSGIGSSPKLIGEYLPSLAGVRLSLSSDDIDEHIDLICNAKNYTNSPYVLTREEMTDIYCRLFGSRA